MKRLLAAFAAATFAASAGAISLGDISNQDAVAGLKQALTQGADYAVKSLGVKDGFLGNPKVTIPLPEYLQKGEGMLRMMGMGTQLDELKVTMNRAAEAAVVEAKPILTNAVKQMTVQDAKGVLTGGDTAATEYFRRTTSDQIAARFAPIVKKYTDSLGVSAQYNQIAGPASQFGLIDAKQSTVDGYVTQKAMDGLFLMVAEQERAIRKDPIGQSSKLLQKVFGAVK
ncbi:MAG TPA: DUF4197 domain-containing protein [Pelomicrobium sp.]|nr:DUF4197 domain-containing protein [Pelomicrobium sp.]